MKLLNTLIALTLALCTALTHAADADPPAVVGRLNYLSGTVSFAPAQADEDWSAAELNRPITTGDRLWTDTSGRAEMHVGSLAIRMGAQTSLDVLALDERTLQLRLAQGSMNLRVRRLASDKLLEIATPTGAVVVKQPGSYRINVDPSGAATMVAVRGGGQVEVFTGNSSFAIRDNQEAEISGSRQDLFAASPPDDFDRWTAGRDEREDRVVSTRYVPEEMTGYEDLDHYGAWRTAPDYGPVWVPTAVPAGWAPYRSGHWVWISPWGWTWVDSAPWGFAPFHYGRWVWLGNHWAWAPGRRIARPVYAPALVAFIGGSNFSVSVGFGSAPAVGWVPLGWREPYRPWYRASRAHVRNVNVTHVTNVTSITNNVTNVRLVNRNAPSAVTVVSRENFVAARRADQAALRVDARTLTAAPVTQGAPVATPARRSFARAERGVQPPAAARTRETVAVNTPPAPARAAIREAREDARNARLAGNDERPRVRVINRGERVNLQQAADSQRPGASAPQAQSQTPRVTQEQSKAGPAEAARNERSPEPAVRSQSTPQPAQAGRSERAQDKAAPPPQPQPNQQAERRAPAPPPEVSRRPAFDRDMRPSTAEARREQRQAERQEQREQPSVQRNDSPRPQAAQPDTRTTATPRPAQEAPRAQQLEQQQQQQAREEQARSQQARQRGAQRQNEERQRVQQQREQQQAQQRQQKAQAQQAAREQQASQREAQQNEERQRAQQQQTRQRDLQQQQRQQQAQEQREQRQQQAQEQREQRQQQQPRADEGREKGRDRQRAEKSEKG